MKLFDAMLCYQKVAGSSTTRLDYDCGWLSVTPYHSDRQMDRCFVILLLNSMTGPSMWQRQCLMVVLELPEWTVTATRWFFLCEKKVHFPPHISTFHFLSFSICCPVESGGGGVVVLLGLSLSPEEMNTSDCQQAVKRPVSADWCLMFCSLLFSSLSVWQELDANWNTHTHTHAR